MVCSVLSGTRLIAYNWFAHAKTSARAINQLEQINLVVDDLVAKQPEKTRKTAVCQESAFVLILDFHQAHY